MSVQNIEFQYEVQLEGNNSYIGISKDDVMVSARLYGRNSNNEQWKLLNNGSNGYRRSLTCSQNDVIEVIFNRPNVLHDPLSEKVYVCSAIVVFQQSGLVYSQYKASTSFLNLQPMYEIGLFTGIVNSTFHTNSKQFAMFEMGFRYTYAVLTLFHFIAFVVITARCQKWKRWHTVQKWLAFMLFLSIWYHDPLFAGQVYSSTWVFPLIESLLSLAFIFGFLLYLLIFFHSLFVPPANRTLIRFYLTKIVLVAIIYVLVNVLIVWSRVYNAADAARYSVTEVPGYMYLRDVVIALFVIYAIDLLYYAIKAFGVVRKMRTKYSNRFWAVASFSVLVVLSFLGVLITESGFRYSSEALGFLVSQTIIYLYFAVLSIFFLPGLNEDKKPAPEVTTKDAPAQEDATLSGNTVEIGTNDDTASHDNLSHEKENAEVQKVEERPVQVSGSDLVRINFSRDEDES
jgi:hypothetical protein